MEKSSNQSTNNGIDKTAAPAQKPGTQPFTKPGQSAGPQTGNGHAPAPVTPVSPAPVPAPVKEAGSPPHAAAKDGNVAATPERKST